MFENIVAISFIGFLIGFAFSIPIAGPLSIMITANALKGNKRFCLQANAGASLIVFIYVFIGVYGLTRLFIHYYSLIPFILLAGAFFLFFAGFKITRTNLSIEILEKGGVTARKNRKTNGFWTGFLINIINPYLFVGWLTSSFIAISFIASLGYNTGGIDTMIQENLTEVNKIENEERNDIKESSGLHTDIFEQSVKSQKDIKKKSLPRYYPLLSSFSYAFFLTLGSISWFFILTGMLIKYRKKLDISVLNKIVRALGYILYLIGALVLYSGITKFLTEHDLWVNVMIS